MLDPSDAHRGGLLIIQIGAAYRSGPVPNERTGPFPFSIRRFEAWRCGSIYCGGEHLGVQYTSHNNDGAAHEKDKNEKRESSDDELHWLPLGRKVPEGYTGYH